MHERQINAVVPFETPYGEVEISVKRGRIRTETGRIDVARAVPGLVMFPGEKTGGLNETGRRPQPGRHGELRGGPGAAPGLAPGVVQVNVRIPGNAGRGQVPIRLVLYAQPPLYEITQHDVLVHGE